MRILERVGRAGILLILVALGTLALVRYAPGYFTDAREMDAQHAESARTELAIRRHMDGSGTTMVHAVVLDWLHGRLGISHKYGIPVGELLRPRLPVTARLLGKSITAGWLCAVAIALPLSAQTSAGSRASIAAGSALLLAVPIGALATLFLLTDTGGPILALGLILAARDFKFVYSLFREGWCAPHVLFARAQGLGWCRLTAAHLLPPLVPRLASLATMSFVLALSALVPVEVLFDVPGIGQLAWTAATNRDIPLLLAITLLMAAAVLCAGLVNEPAQTPTVHPGRN